MAEETTPPINTEYLKETELDIDTASELVSYDKFDEAIKVLENRIEHSDCSVCKLELNTAVDDIKASQEACMLGDDNICKEGKEIVVTKLQELKEVMNLAASEDIIL